MAGLTLITEDHLRRGAVAYIRQSSPEQVEENTGSTALQRELPYQRLQQLGWRPDQIDPIEDDLGVSAAVAGHRRGFDDLLDRMEAGQVGGVAVADISRLSRNELDLARFADVARRRNVLLAHGSQLVNFADYTDGFVTMVQGNNAARENRARADWSRRARRKKAEAGEITTRPPVGLVRTDDGQWEKHREPRIRDTIMLVFDKFDEVGSVRRTVRWLHEHRVELPRAGKRGRITWVKAKTHHVYDMLRNPAYAGTYVYGRTAVAQPGDPAPNGQQRQLHRPKGEWVCLQNHHPGYISPERWATIQERLRTNRRTNRSPLGRGEALAQGLLRCQTHGVSFHTEYPGRKRAADGTIRRSPYYICRPFTNIGRSTVCSTVQAQQIDERLEAELLRTLSPPSLELLKQAGREALREHDARSRMRQEQRLRAEQAVAEAERAYDQVPPANRLVKQRLADRYEQALQRVRDLRTDYQLHPLVPPLTLDESDLKELADLCADLPRLWRHPHVTHEQRKAIVRAVVKAIHATPAPDLWHLDIEWVGGARTGFEIPSIDRVHEVIRDGYGAGLTDQELTEHLRSRGFLRRRSTHAGRPYSLAAVRSIIKRDKLQRPFNQQAHPLIRARADAGVSYKHVADELNAKKIRHRLGPWTESRVATAVRRLRHGRVPGVEPLPSLTPLTTRVVELRNEGLVPTDIVARLHAEGYQSQQRRAVTPGAVFAILHRSGLRSPAAVANERVTALLREWAGRVPILEISRRLHELGLRTMRGSRWTEASVTAKLRSLGLRPSTPRRRSALGRFVSHPVSS
jgi:DNA invertase Pin-like site-specific DNA recombinase